MLLLKAKYLESKELPAKGDFPPSTLVSVLAGTDTLHLIGRKDALDQLGELDPFADVTFELRWRQVDLATLGGKGKTYRLSVARICGEGEASSPGSSRCRPACTRCSSP